ncbi:MAG: 5'/3'-nucleotidase SurE [Candidatus Aminicenantales bacterium]
MKNKKEEPILLLTNDDGFFSEGITSLEEELKNIGKVFIVAPDREKSATSLALTLNRPLRVQKIRNYVYAVDGTPADCIYIGVEKLLPGRPDLIISGLNKGPNLGQQDISYSGTVAGAIQGTFFAIPSLAVSLLPDKNGTFHFDFSARFTSLLAEHILRNGLPEGVTVNINIPSPPIQGIRLTKLGQRLYSPEIIEKKDPNKRSYYWIGPGNPKVVGDDESDIIVVNKGFISVTPLHTDKTDYKTLELSGFKKIFAEISPELT